MLPHIRRDNSTPLSPAGQVESVWRDLLDFHSPSTSTSQVCLFQSGPSLWGGAVLQGVSSGDPTLILPSVFFL